MKKSNYLFSSPQFVRFCSISSITIWITTIILGLLIAQLDRAGPGYDPSGFNPFINYISDLGSLRFTPLPIILNFGMISTGLLMIPVSFSIRRLLIGDGSNISRKILGNITLIILLIGMAGFFMTGVLSEDTGEIFDQLIGFPFDEYAWHDLVSDFAFIFFMASGILVASQFVVFKSILDKEIGVKNPKVVRIILLINTWILTPIFFGFFYSVPYLWYETPFWTYLPLWQWAPFWEWLLMFSLSGSLFSVTLMHLKPLNRQIKQEVKA
jgi:hypothetical membrane protein